MDSVAVEFRVVGVADVHGAAFGPQGVFEHVAAVAAANHELGGGPPGVAPGIHVVLAARIPEDHALRAPGSSPAAETCFSLRGGIVHGPDRDLSAFRDGIAPSEEHNAELVPGLFQPAAGVDGLIGAGPGIPAVNQGLLPGAVEPDLREPAAGADVARHAHLVALERAIERSARGGGGQGARARFPRPGCRHGVDGERHVRVFSPDLDTQGVVMPDCCDAVAAGKRVNAVSIAVQLGPLLQFLAIRRNALRDEGQARDVHGFRGRVKGGVGHPAVAVLNPVHDGRAPHQVVFAGGPEGLRHPRQGFHDLAQRPRMRQVRPFPGRDSVPEQAVFHDPVGFAVVGGHQDHPAADLAGPFAVGEHAVPDPRGRGGVLVV